MQCLGFEHHDPRYITKCTNQNYAQKQQVCVNLPTIGRTIGWFRKISWQNLDCGKCYHWLWDIRMQYCRLLKGY